MQGECVLGQGQAEEGEDGFGMTAVIAEPGGDAAVAGQAEEVEGGVAQLRHDARPGPPVEQATILPQHDILDAVEAVFHAPVPALVAEQLRGVGGLRGEAGDPVVDGAFVLAPPARPIGCPPPSIRRLDCFM